MLNAHRVADIRDAEAAAMVRVGPDELMQRAADGLAHELSQRIPPGAPTVMLIGPGNNGGDALFAAARLCHAGRSVDLCLLDQQTVHATGLDAAITAGAQVIGAPADHRFVVDAIFGIGARPGLTGKALDWVEWVRHTQPYVIAVDVPSGIGVDDGTCPEAVMPADLTITFGTYKIGTLIGPGGAVSGQQIPVRVDIGLGPHLTEPAVQAFEPSDGVQFAKLLTPSATSHKYSRGVLGVRAGSAEFAGAAHLVVAGAQAGPAGMLRFIGEQGLTARVVDRAPEVVGAAGRVQAWVVGPGGPTSADPLDEALADSVPLVVDATALHYLPPRFNVDAVLTPHAGELAAMLQTDREAVEADPLGHATAAAQRWRATVLLKGARTLIVAADGRVRVNLRGTPWLATAGSGDVLAGLLGSLLAAGLPGFDAASVAAYVHGVAGERAAALHSFVARDIAVELRRVLRDFVTDRASTAAENGL